MVINKMFFSFYIKETYLIKICLLINHSELISHVYNGFFKMVYVFYFRQFKIIIYNWSFVCQLLSEKKMNWTTNYKISDHYTLTFSFYFCWVVMDWFISFLLFFACFILHGMYLMINSLMEFLNYPTWVLISPSVMKDLRILEQQSSLKLSVTMIVVFLVPIKIPEKKDLSYKWFILIHNFRIQGIPTKCGGSTI